LELKTLTEAPHINTYQPITFSHIGAKFSRVHGICDLFKEFK